MSDLSARVAEHGRRWLLPAALMATGVVLAAVAHADPIAAKPRPGEPLTFQGVAWVTIEVLVVLVEALSYWIWLRISRVRALGTSLVANVASAAVGYLIYSLAAGGYESVWFVAPPGEPRGAWHI